jgi:hypothetical protein
VQLINFCDDDIQVLAAPVIPLYHLDNYSFGTKEPQLEKDGTIKARMERYERVSSALVNK